MTTHFVIARRTAGRRGNPSYLGGSERSCLFVYWFTVDRHGLRPRDDNTLCHCEKDRMDDAAIHRVSEVGGRTGLRFAYWLRVDRHGLRPRDDKKWG